ncbi:MAG TPA: MgtC/SapB family protein [Bacteroidia bacterium]|nr:MgtC/SapB family protein [Bacteroidia bacterium]
MDVHTELGNLLPRILVATALGGIIGMERERSGSYAGIRTFAAVSLGASMLTAINLHLGLADPTRMVANIISGIGFLGAGIIFRDSTKGNIAGLNTAATLWATASVGIAAGFGMYVISIACTIILYLLLLSRKVPFIKKLGDSAKKDKESKTD